MAIAGETRRGGIAHGSLAGPVSSLEECRVHLREVDARDGGAIASLLADPRVTRYLLRPAPQTAVDVERWIERMHRRRDEGGGHCFAVVRAGTARIVGLGQVVRVDPPCGLEWGWLLSPDTWGSGIFTECAGLLLAHAWAHFQAPSIAARVHADNTRAVRALMKLGSLLQATSGHTQTWVTATRSSVRADLDVQ